MKDLLHQTGHCLRVDLLLHSADHAPGSMVRCLGVNCHSSDQSRVMVGYIRLLLVLAITLCTNPGLILLLPKNVGT